MMKCKKRGAPAAIFLAAFSFLLVLPLFGQTFSQLNLSQDDRFLFKAEFEFQNAVFLSTLNNDNPIQQLTAFPEKLQAVDNGRVLLVQNQFGIVRLPTAGGLPAVIPGSPSFAERRLPLKGRLQEFSASNDGRWITCIEPASPAYGTLYIINTSNGTKRIVTERIELPAKDFPVKWSPDSRLFVYAKEGRLYYFPIISDLSVMIDERFRLMGQGSINSVVWGQQGDFFYISGNTLYSVINPELFTRTIYGDFLSIGNVVLKLPFEFDSGFDRYWIAPNSSFITINKNDKGLFLFFLGERTSNSSLHISIHPGAENLNVLSSHNNIKILYSINNSITAEQFNIVNDTIIGTDLDIVPVTSNGILSPDGSKAIFLGDQGLELWDFENWRLIQKLFSEPVLSCAWINNNRFVMGTVRFISEVNISGTTATQRRICLSSADEIGYETVTRGQSRVLARVGAEWFATDTRSGWVSVNEPTLRQASLATDRFRVSLESNIPMINNMRSMTTTSLLSKHTSSKAYPQRENTKIALCFDLYDDDTGLYQVLKALERSNIKATFFLNGEFIRRNPAAAQAIVQAGHEAGSMFYAPIDLSDSRYRITREFIIQGLARNDDEYNEVTGKELLKIWHSPYYRASDLITSAASSAGYTYIPRTLDLQDWISGTEAARLNIRQIPPSQMIEQIIEQTKNEAVIPVRLGLLAGGRDEYLFQRIDVLLDALARSGIEVVPVSEVSR